MAQMGEASGAGSDDEEAARAPGAVQVARLELPHGARPLIDLLFLTLRLVPLPPGYSPEGDAARRALISSLAAAVGDAAGDGAALEALRAAEPQVAEALAAAAKSLAAEMAAEPPRRGTPPRSALPVLQLLGALGLSGEGVSHEALALGKKILDHSWKSPTDSTGAFNAAAEFGAQRERACEAYCAARAAYVGAGRARGAGARAALDALQDLGKRALEAGHLQRRQLRLAGRGETIVLAALTELGRCCGSDTRAALHAAMPGGGGRGGGGGGGARLHVDEGRLQAQVAALAAETPEEGEPPPLEDAAPLPAPDASEAEKVAYIFRERRDLDSKASFDLRSLQEAPGYNPKARGGRAAGKGVGRATPETLKAVVEAIVALLKDGNPRARRRCCGGRCAPCASRATTWGAGGLAALEAARWPCMEELAV